MTNLKVTDVRSRVNESWSLFCGNSGDTAKVENERALMKN